MAACRYGISFLVFNLLSHSCQVIYPYFQNFTYCKKYLKDDKHDSLDWAQKYINNNHHLARKYARIFVRWHYLFREANSFPRAKLEENCELPGTDNVQGQISEHIFARNGTVVFIIRQIFFATRSVLKIGEYSRIFPSFSWGIFGHVARLGQSRVSKKIWWIISSDICPWTLSIPPSSQFSSSYALY